MIWVLTLYCAASSPSWGDYVALRNRYEFQTEDSCVEWAKMYAKAIYKPQMPGIASVEALIEDDKKQFLDSRPGMKILESKGLTTADGKVLRSFEYVPDRQGDWEQVSYGEEGDFYLIFTISSRSKTGYGKSIPVYEELIERYREKP